MYCREMSFRVVFVVFTNLCGMHIWNMERRLFTKGQEYRESTGRAPEVYTKSSQTAREEYKKSTDNIPEGYSKDTGTTTERYASYVDAATQRRPNGTTRSGIKRG